MHRRLLALTRNSRLALAATILTGLLAGILTILQANALSRVVEGVFLGGQVLAGAAGMLEIILFLVILRALLVWGNEVSARSVAEKVKSDLRARLFSKLLQLGPAFTRAERSGELVATAVEGVETLEAYFSLYLPQLVIAAVVPLSILVVVFPRDLLSGLVLLVTAPLIPVFMYLIGKAAEALTKRQWDTLGRLSAYFLDSLQGLVTLKQFGRSKDQVHSIEESSDRFRDVTLGVLRVTFLSALVLELVATVSTAVVAVEVGLRLLYGRLAFQQAFFLLLLAPEFYQPLRMLGLRFHAGMSGVAAAGRIFGILDVPAPREPRLENAVPYVGTRISTIELRRVSFTYPGESQPALQEISLEIEAGRHVALVGPSGAGKTTLAFLLLRFIAPSAGAILVDGRSLSQLPADDWCRQVAWVPQQPYLFHDTLAANLRLAKADASGEEMNAALQSAHLDEFVAALPEGLETIVGEEGARLSSGQAQRLALARAFLKNAPLLILDEPTSGLDPENEALLEEALQCLMRGHTVITIAHRLNTVFRADRIFVLERGRLVETGTHPELLAANGTYARLVRANLEAVASKADKAGYGPELIRPAAAIRRPASAIPSLVETAVTSESEIVNRKSEIGNRKPSLLRLLGFLQGAWGWVLLSVLLGALTVGSNISLMGISAYLISAAALHPELGTLQLAIVAVRFFGIGRGVFRYLERLVSHGVTFRLLARLRVWFYRALEPLAPARLMQYRSGDLLSRIVADVGTLENFYVRSIAPPLVALAVAAGVGAFLAACDPRLAIAYLLFVLLLGAGLPWLTYALSARPGRQLAWQRAGLHTVLVDGIQGLADLTAFGQGRNYLLRLRSSGKDYARTQRQLARVNGFQSAGCLLLSNLGMGTVLILSIPQVRAGRIDGVMLATLALVTLAGFEAVLPLPQAAQTLTDSLQAARRLFEIVDTRPAVSDPSRPRPAPGSGALRVEGVRFSYGPGEPPALDGVDIDLPPGKRLAVVGPSGAGKSTLVNILQRFWEYREGRILLDGHEIRSYNQDDVRRTISVIPQRPYFFNDTIRRNLLLARPAGGEAVMEQAARQAQIHEFIAGLPRGYDTVIGERGLRLSGGERQRLAFARALLKDAPLLILDEPTANLDPVTERQILDLLFSRTQNRSLLLITHRLVGLEHMDEIVVLEHGLVTERGRHAGLLAGHGLYRRMWDLQNRILTGME